MELFGQHVTLQLDSELVFRRVLTLGALEIMCNIVLTLCNTV